MKILVLAGGADQIALICELKRRGHTVVLIDYFENPPARDYADKHIVASTLDVERVKAIAVAERVGLVCTACTDQALLTVANVSEQLGLPCYLSHRLGLNVTNKSYMKKILADNGIPTARYAIIDKQDVGILENFTFPLVVKPVDCNSSKGVSLVDEEEQLALCIENAIKASRTCTAVVEEYKKGDEISADFYIKDGKAIFLSATKSVKIPKRSSFTIIASIYPVVDLAKQRELERIADCISAAFGIVNAPLLVQLIDGEEGMSVIEFSARMGGGSKYSLIHRLTGVDIMAEYVSLILGETPSVNPSKQVEYAKMVYIYCTPGVFDHLEGFDILKDTGVIDDYFQYKTAGMKIEHVKTSGDRPAGYLITANTAKELDDKQFFVDSHVKVISSIGEDMMIHGLF